MSNYRDEVEAARLRATTLEAELAEKEAELQERDASLAAREARIHELEAAVDRQREPSAPPGRGEPKRSATAAITILLVLVAAGAGGFVLLARPEAPPPRAKPAPAEPQDVPATPPAPPEPAPAPPEPVPAPPAESGCGCAPEDLMCQMRCSAGKSTLNINSIPPSTVLIDGKPHGTTPLVGVSVKPGSHRVVLRHPERGTQSRSVNIANGETKTVAVRFD